MELIPQITFKDVPPSDAAEKTILEKASKRWCNLFSVKKKKGILLKELDNFS